MEKKQGWQIENIICCIISICELGGKKMLFEDKYGALMMPEEVEELSSWEIIERHIHASELDEV